jgi:nucleoside-diphosphate-sugar epimerase
LLDEGFTVRAVDIKPLCGDNGEEGWWQVWPKAENIAGHEFGDLTNENNCHSAVDDIDYVYNLACMMGGIGFIHHNWVECMRSVLISLHLLEAEKRHGVRRHFYSSSACVYPKGAQDRPDMPALKESDAWPAQPEKGYGMEKLFTEELCEAYRRERGLECRIARFHNIMGPYGTWEGGKEKAPAAICRKVAEAVVSGKHEIDIWGDGTFTRSFCWVEDCVEGIRRIMDSGIEEPINLGSSEQVTVNQLADIVEDIAGVKCNRNYDLSKPQGVPGRNSDNTMILERLGWEPKTSLRYGLEQTYAWVLEKVQERTTSTETW